jgi:hypothetical protein
MLTAELLRYRRRAGGVVPHLLDPRAPAARDAAAALIATVQGHLGRSRGKLEEALRAGPPPGLDARTAQGLARLLLERCTFEVRADVAPAALREAVLDAAAAAWRADAGAGTAPWRGAVLARAAAPLGLSLAEAEATLFADLEDQQRLLSVAPLVPGAPGAGASGKAAPGTAAPDTGTQGAEALLYRYNTAQVQGLLLRAEDVRITAPWPAPRRLRQLLRYLKFYGLLFRDESRPVVAGGAAAGLALVVDGPLSVLDSATRYGLNLAEFFPALLLWDPPWALEATLRLGRGAGKPAQLRLQPHPWLRSHYPDHGQWVAREVERFVEAFNAGPPPWRAVAAEALLALPGNRSLVPDFELRRADGAPRARGGPMYLEHLPTPDAPALALRLEQLAAAGRRDYLLVCRATPAVQALGPHPALLTYRRTLLPSLVREALREREG